ncbi:UNVERIFIED_CONTAM: hypothetical protein K2H54_004081 [Gekko kuhli]
MLGSRVCWQLLLGWALLLGQPVFGDSDAEEEPPLAESEGPVPDSPEPEEPLSESPEPEEPVPDSPEPEEPLSESPEPEEPVPEAEEPEELVPELEEPEKELTSDELLEEEEKQDREWLKERLARPWNYEVNNIRQTALEHHHKHSQEYYSPFENANLITQKAIGTMIYLRLIVVKTNCTNDQRPEEEESDHGYYYRLYHADRYPRNCEPLSDSKKQLLLVANSPPGQ